MGENSKNVDMMAEAREAQWSAQTFMGDDAVRAFAPAKVNLFLSIGSKLPSGYHEALSVMHSLALHDVLYLNVFSQNETVDSFKASQAEEPSQAAINAGPEENISVKIDMIEKTHISGAGFSGMPAGADARVQLQDNLVFKAIDMLACKANITESQEVHVRVEKHIPSKAGLGGGSSDAVASMRAISRFWGEKVTDEAILEVSKSIGADVPFFMNGGCAIYDGMGDRIVRALDPMKHSVVLVRPKAGVPTVEAYAQFDKSPETASPKLIDLVAKTQKAGQVPLFNSLQPASCRILPEIGNVIDWLRKKPCVMKDRQGKPMVLMSGSGSCVFAITEAYSDAVQIASEAAKRDWWSRATSFSSLSACSL